MTLDVGINLYKLMWQSFTHLFRTDRTFLMENIGIVLPWLNVLILPWETPLDHVHQHIKPGVYIILHIAPSPPKVRVWTCIDWGTCELEVGL